MPGALRDRLLSGPLEAMLAATLRFGRLPPPEERPLLLAGPRRRQDADHGEAGGAPCSPAPRRR
ncbi:hypothetical protein [Teichococcus aestuarii]|uniref:hypothetical protein n=1 Tax=Teichococcus aestuarii TaxID=568898 RepID=UPI003619C372